LRSDFWFFSSNPSSFPKESLVFSLMTAPPLGAVLTVSLKVASTLLKVFFRSQLSPAGRKVSLSCRRSWSRSRLSGALNSSTSYYTELHPLLLCTPGFRFCASVREVSTRSLLPPNLGEVSIPPFFRGKGFFLSFPLRTPPFLCPPVGPSLPLVSQCRALQFFPDRVLHIHPLFARPRPLFDPPRIFSTPGLVQSSHMSFPVERRLSPLPFSPSCGLLFLLAGDP